MVCAENECLEPHHMYLIPLLWPFISQLHFLASPLPSCLSLHFLQGDTQTDLPSICIARPAFSLTLNLSFQLAT
ncbi:hypothetical protein Ae201684P_017938 [Aphanomyces euteiches]|uniref:Uncharacterized protein n=1 Tax=Aphanomyces euteiches TaxID=100861 RepID=A0A6G0XLZ0_9STRA|nr:hypothetical protein Ae201684_003504 [Aphanomyces euteiches]KAH9098727.1 hypothetical protein Ae201684P_017938 [Aphanomyces euteiches]